MCNFGRLITAFLLGFNGSGYGATWTDGESGLRAKLSVEHQERLISVLHDADVTESVLFEIAQSLGTAQLDLDMDLAENKSPKESPFANMSGSTPTSPSLVGSPRRKNSKTLPRSPSPRKLARASKKRLLLSSLPSSPDFLPRKKKESPGSSNIIDDEDAEGSFDVAGDTLLLRAIKQGTAATIGALLAFGASIHPYALHEACKSSAYDAQEMLKMLLSNGAIMYVNVEDDQGFLPLHYLVRRLSKDGNDNLIVLMIILIDNGAKSDWQGTRPESPFDLFVKEKYWSCGEPNLVLRTLIEGCDPNLKIEGHSIIDTLFPKSSRTNEPQKYESVRKIVERAAKVYPRRVSFGPPYPNYNMNIKPYRLK